MSVVTDHELAKMVAEEDKATCCSSLFYTWLSPLFILASQKVKLGGVINQDDLSLLPSGDKAKPLVQTFQSSWVSFLFIFFIYYTFVFTSLYNTTITHTFCFKSNFSLFFYNFFPHRTNMPFLPKRNSIYKTTTNSISLIQTLPTNNHKN